MKKSEWSNIFCLLSQPLCRSKSADKIEDFFQPRFFDGSDANYVSKDFLQIPFPYSENNPFTEYEIDDNISDEEFAEIHIRDISGTITLAHQGCRYFDMLIISGKEKGTDWYFSWLNTSLGK